MPEKASPRGIEIHQKRVGSGRSRKTWRAMNSDQRTAPLIGGSRPLLPGRRGPPLFPPRNFLSYFFCSWNFYSTHSPSCQGWAAASRTFVPSLMTSKLIANHHRAAQRPGGAVSPTAAVTSNQDGRCTIRVASRIIRRSSVSSCGGRESRAFHLA